jgi:hypothetical protein
MRFVAAINRLPSVPPLLRDILLRSIDDILVFDKKKKLLLDIHTMARNLLLKQQ